MSWAFFVAGAFDVDGYRESYGLNMAAVRPERPLGFRRTQSAMPRLPDAGPESSMNVSFLLRRIHALDPYA